MHLGLFVQETGQHVAAWRHPGAHMHAGFDFNEILQVALTAEGAKFDLLFLSDVAAVDTAGPAEQRQRMGKVVKFEPITLLSALAARTTHLGLVATATTTYNQPFTVARQFASLDQLSGGRAGWNLVTSNTEIEALNFSRDEHLAHADRYNRASEFADVVAGLWESWEDDAFVRDREAGVFFDPAKQHVLDHRGEHFQVRGPLNIARSPQGRPVIVQAGSSDVGRGLAARTAEVVFTAQSDFDDAKAFYQDIQARLVETGRQPGALKILPGLYPVVGRTREEAQAKYDALQALIHPSVGLAMLEHTIGVKGLDQYPLDGPVPDLGETEGPLSRQRLVLQAARKENLTLRQLCLKNAGPRGHLLAVGTAEDIVDLMERWFVGGAADGFNVMPAWLPGSLDDFVRDVMPELRRRGLFRTDYAGSTLREHLQLPYPAPRRMPGQAVA